MTDLKLSEDHELQVQAYLRFAKLKRDQHVRETLAVITEFKNDRLSPGEMYNYQEIKQLLEDMSSEMKALVDKEIQHAYHTNALLVKILLNQAQANGLDFQVDTNALENEFLLKGIAASESTALKRPASDFVRRNQALGKIGSINIVQEDTGAAKERDALGSELSATKQRMQELQQQTTQFMRERSALTEQINQLKDQLAEKDSLLASHEASRSAVQKDLAALSLNAKGAASASEAQYDELRKQLNEQRGLLEDMRTKYNKAAKEVETLEKENKSLRGDMDAHVRDSKPFQQMQDMMKKKSAEVVDLKKRLGKYEPQSVPSAD